MHTRYEQAFYTRRGQSKEYAAREMLGHLRAYVPEIGSAVDVGCGVGTWLAELAAHGCDVQGYDGPWVDVSALKIEGAHFVRTDLSVPVPTSRRFDLAISLEVAEHLPEEAAPGFVETLTRLSDVVLFSAAVPGQGGTHHVNEQWQSYWRALFRDHGHVVVDLFRERFWDDGCIPAWYRQNTFVYVREAALYRYPKLAARRTAGAEPLMDVVHPELYGQKSLLAVRRRLARLVGAGG